MISHGRQSSHTQIILVSVQKHDQNMTTDTGVGVVWSCTCYNTEVRLLGHCPIELYYVLMAKGRQYLNLHNVTMYTLLYHSTIGYNLGCNRVKMFTHCLTASYYATFVIVFTTGKSCGSVV